MITTIPKEEAIKFLIEKCYKNFHELIDMIPEDKMYNILNENISIILGHSETSKDCSGSYWTSFKKIDLFEIQEGDTIEKIKHTIAHEGIHALFRKNFTDTGCYKWSRNDFSVNKIVGIARTSAKRFKSNKSILSEMKILKQLLADKNYIKNFGCALNEGFTEWCASKSIGEPDVTYSSQVRIIEILECILGTKEVLKIGKGNDQEIAKMLNMDMTEYNVFMAQMDEILFLENMQSKMNNKSNTLDKLIKKKETIDKAKKFSACEVINTLIEKFIIPNLNLNSKPTLEDFKKLCKINNLTNDFLEEIWQTYYFIEERPLKTLLMEKLTNIINSNNFKVDELSFEDCESILDAIFCTEEENSIISQAIDMLYARMDRISEERFHIMEDKIREIQGKDNQSINIYEINQIINSIPITRKAQEDTINLLFQGNLTDEEKQQAYIELYDIIDYGERYNENYYDEVFTRQYFTEENGFNIKKIEIQETDHKDNIQYEDETSIKFKPIEINQKETTKTFFRKLINKVIKLKNLTMEDIEETRENDHIKEGEQEFE